jgi:hypothetical protein
LVELVGDGRRRGAEGPTSSKLCPTGAVWRGELTYEHHGHSKAAARAHGNDLLPCPMNFDEGGAPVILWRRKEAV